MTLLRDSIPALERGDTLSTTQMEQMVLEVMDGGVPTDTLAQWLRAMAQRVPTADELVGGARAFMSRAVRVRCRTAADRIVDTCGTGGAPKVFNVSTLAALLVAASGAPVAKHGNRSRTGFGSAETLEALGMRLDATPQALADALDSCGFCFCMAPRHHPGAAHAAAARRMVTGPTVFNALGPLCNPAGAGRQLLGVWSAEMLRPMSEALARLGCTHALVVHAMDGLDEISVCAPTMFVRVLHGAVVEQGTLTPESFGMHSHQVPAPASHSLPEAVTMARDLLQGTCSTTHSDMLVLNAAAALVVSGKADRWADSAVMARGMLEQGRGMALLQTLI